MENIIGEIIMGVVIIGLVVFGIIRYKKIKEREKNKNESLNDLDLVETKVMAGDGYEIIIDDENKKFAITTDEIDRYAVYDYKDFIDCQVVENDGEKSKSSGNAGKVILGAMFLGGIGALAGMSGERKVKTIKFIYSLSVRILVKDIKRPFYQIDLISQKCKNDSDIYEDAVRDIAEIVATFDLIKNQNQGKEQK